MELIVTYKPSKLQENLKNQKQRNNLSCKNQIKQGN